MSRKLRDYPEPRAPRPNRRAEPRTPVSGMGWMEPLDGTGREEFQLMDASSSGFRVCHHYIALSAGQRVRFHTDQADGIAVAVWNLVKDAEVESGFLIVSRAK